MCVLAAKPSALRCIQFSTQWGFAPWLPSIFWDRWGDFKKYSFAPSISAECWSWQPTWTRMYVVLKRGLCRPPTLIMPVRASLSDKGECETILTGGEERSNRMKREVWDALLSADGTISRSEVQHLNGRAGGLMENASPVYIRGLKLGHVYEWLKSNSQYCCLWCLHPCSTADSRERKTVAVCWNCRKKNKSQKMRQE